ncbi:hypothetical protein V6N11_035417 [Hibiscus sabdariffa]|uniref:Uncharacterized protein n=1 Tax=Hibiscus sabdariffa TaxID=183260 RepID=A0ABR2R0C4_9ROSI
MKQQSKEATGKAHSSVTRAVFHVVTGASRLCQHTQSAIEVAPLADVVAESTQELHEDKGAPEGAVSLNNSGREDGLTGSEPEVASHGAETVSPRVVEQMAEVVPEREGELPEIPGLLSTGCSQHQQGVSEEQSLQHEGSSGERDLSVTEPLQGRIEEHMQHEGSAVIKLCLMNGSKGAARPLGFDILRVSAVSDSGSGSGRSGGFGGSGDGSSGSKSEGTDGDGGRSGWSFLSW